MTLAAVDHEKALAELDQLMAETYQLWDEEWVGFSWRNYTYDHVARVRALARTLGQSEGADDLVIRYGATLHDITKSFDGEILTAPDGKRVVDENGLWLNVHSKSGAIVANALLDEYGLPKEFRDHVQEVIHSHLMPRQTSSVEGRCLYDADTVDANIGLPAFYRNIRISTHRQEDQFAARGEDLDAWLDANRDQFLREYLGEKVPAWNEGKRRDFVSKLTLSSSQEVAGARVDRLGVLLEQMKGELDDPAAALESGMLAVVWRFIKNRRNPSLTKELVYLELEHCHGEPKSPAANLIMDIRKEVAGER
jgi:putative nucleotidyltransferase with HDIG domain